MVIRLFITGGTIDSKINPVTKKYFFTKTHIPKMLKQAYSKVDIELEILMLKDSNKMNDEDRQLILQKCWSCKENKIVITHGTGTMIETARALGKNIKNKTIVLTGSMIPFTSPRSDALFNLGCAITAMQILPKGVYITMHGKIFHWDNVRKDKKQYVFEELKKT